MKTLLSLVAGVALLSRPAAGEDRSAVGQSRSLGSHAPPLESSWTSKAAAGSGVGRAAPLTTPSAAYNGYQSRRRRRRRPQPPPGSPGDLARLRGGWLGVDLVKEIAKAYISPPASATGRDDEDQGMPTSETMSARPPPASGQGYPGGGREGRGAGDGGDTSTPTAAAAAAAAATTNAATGRTAAGVDQASGSSGSGAGAVGGAGEGRGSAEDRAVAAGAAGGDGSRSGGGGGVQGKMSRLRSALQQVGDVSSSTNPPTSPATSPAAGTPGGRGSTAGSGHTNSNKTPNLERFPASGSGDVGPGGRHSNAPEGSSGGGPNAAGSAANGDGLTGANAYNNNNNGYHANSGGGGQHSSSGGPGGSETGRAGATAAAPTPSSAEDERRWEDGAARTGGGSGGASTFGEFGERWFGFDGEVEGGASPPGEGGEREREGEEEEDEELARARAAVEAAREESAAATKASVDAARAQNEIALLREIESVQDRALGRPQQAVTWGQWGEYTRSVVTNVMPARFIDEVCAHIASALAVAAFKGLINAVVNGGQKKNEKVAFKDVVGCDEAKEEVKQIVDFLVDPSAYDSLGATRPKGILLVGPPGTGKTLIAKACAGEAGVPFLYACGSDFNGVYVGMGVAAVKRIFAKARKHKKSIIYIDEIDYLGRARGGGSREASGATQDREATLNQLLSEMDGFEGKDGIVVMASTNRKEILDDALLRSGRFDMQVDVDRPDRKGREQLFSKYIAPLKLSDEEEPSKEAGGGGSGHGGAHRGGGRGGRWGSSAARAAEREKQAAIRKQGLREDIAKELADMTPYMTGADVANVCATAGRIAARAGSDSVVLEHFSAAVDRVLHGLEKPDKEVSKEDRERTAIHEAGHAVAAWMLPWCDEVVKVSIVWRGNALGFSQTAMVERQSQMREMVLDSVCMTLAGRAAEEVVCETISGGASSDLRVASRQLYSAITEVGFGSTSLLAPGNRQVSERVMAEVDEEVQTLLAQQYQRAVALVRTHRDKIDSLAKALLEQNVVHKADLRRILGEKVTVESEEAAAEAALNSALLKGDGRQEEGAPACSERDAATAATPTEEASSTAARNTDAPATA